MNGDVLDPGIGTTGKGQGPDLVIVRGRGHVIVMPTDNDQGLGHMIAMPTGQDHVLGHMIVTLTDIHGLNHMIVTIRGTLARHQDEAGHNSNHKTFWHIVIGITDFIHI